MRNAFKKYKHAWYCKNICDICIILIDKQNDFTWFVNESNGRVQSINIRIDYMYIGDSLSLITDT